MSPESFQAPDLEHLSELLPTLEFQSFIAKGGMGAVYRARQRSLDRDVAVKVLPRELGADPEFHACFETEAKAMARFNHPNLISVYDFGDIDGMPFIVMEYVDGKSLYHSAWNKKIDPRQAVEIGAGICRGLAHAHEHGVVHRDIKPANILLTPKAEPKIGDFGLARPADYDGPQLVMGTPGYTAPEFLDNPEQADARADLYAVGVILHELVTGVRPDDSGKPPEEPTGNLRLDAIWRKATQADPNRRYASAEAMAEALEGWLKNPGPNTAGPPPPAGTPESPATPGQAAVSPKPLAAGKLPQGSPKNAEPPALSTNTGSNWSLVRNLLIIAALLVGIAFAYKAYERKKADNDRKAEQAKKEEFDRQRRLQAELEAQERAAEEARRQAALEAAKNPQPEPEPEPKVETPLESLERLRLALADGGREEMPKGTIRKGDRDIFVVEKLLSWHQAAAFAEAHGGHLAIVRSVDDVSWFTEILPRNTTVWLGAGRTAGDQWLNVDGSDWLLERTPPGAGAFASIDDLGVLRARRRAERFPFIIQWNRDGSNPATLAAMLRRTRETLDSPSPAYPPGTEAQDARHFAIIPRPLDRLDAAQLARQAGGTLAVPATEAEADWLESRVAELPDITGGFWLGGIRQGDLWTWDTGEAWSFARWGDGADPADAGSGLVMTPTRGWRTLDPGDEAAGFVIEWSDDAEKAESRPEEMEAVDDGLSELQKKAGELVTQAIRERDEKLSANARTFIWDLDVWLRGLNHGDRARWGLHVDALKGLVKNDRVPSPEDLAGGGESSVGEKPQIQLTEPMAKACRTSYLKQVEIDRAHVGKLERIRDAYVERLRNSEKEVRARGQDALAKQLREAATEAGDLDAWVGRMTE